MTTIRNIILGNNKNLDRKGYMWNTACSVLDAATQPLMILIVKRVLSDVKDADIFSMAFITAQVLLTIGYYGVRNYQITDSEGRYSFDDYLSARVLTTVLMLVIGGIFVKAMGYDNKKSLVVIFICILKMTDSLEDVYGGYYQLKKRLDVSGKIWSVRIVKYVVVFALVLSITKNLIIASAAAALVSFVILFLFHLSVKKEFLWKRPSFQMKKVFRLLRECFPLCVGAFVFTYITTIPKYTIDNIMGKGAPTIFAILFMPCAIITMMITMLLRPIMPRLSEAWHDKNYKSFRTAILRMFGLTLILSLLVIAGGYFLGCLLLGVVYGVDLSAYQMELTVILIGGSLFACATVIQHILTVVRFQSLTIFAYIVACVVGNVFAPSLVRSNGIMGGALNYLLIVLVLTISFILITLIFYLRERIRIDKKEIGD